MLLPQHCFGDEAQPTKTSVPLEFSSIQQNLSGGQHPSIFEIPFLEKQGESDSILQHPGLVTEE
jgi:hypothetical protein